MTTAEIAPSSSSSNSSSRNFFHLLSSSSSNNDNNKQNKKKHHHHINKHNVKPNLIPVVDDDDHDMVEHPSSCLCGIDDLDLIFSELAAAAAAGQEEDEDDDDLPQTSLGRGGRHRPQHKLLQQLKRHQQQHPLSSSSTKPLPHEEALRRLAMKLRELQRADSGASGFSARTRDSGFQSQQHSEAEYGGSVFLGSENTGSELPSGAYGCSSGALIIGGGGGGGGGGTGGGDDCGGVELQSGFLDHYGLDGPLPPPVPSVAPPAPQSPQQQRRRPPLPPMPSGGGVISVGARKKRRLEDELKQATIRQHYYPEGGWGYVVLLAGFLAQAITHGLQMSFGVVLIGLLRRFNDEGMQQQQHYGGGHDDVGGGGATGATAPAAAAAVGGDVGEDNSHHTLPERYLEAGFLGSLCLSVSLLLSPLTIGVCRRKSTRVTAVIGGLVAALGCLFSSFATQFHQLYFSYGAMIGVGVGMTRDTASLMLGQYFKRRREVVEVVGVAATGAGIAIMSVFIMEVTSSVGWRLGLQAVTGLVAATFLLGTFYRSASLYHPQRRAILHLKTQKRKIKNKSKELNKLQDDSPPFFDFATLRSRTVQIMLGSTALAFAGINAPILLLGPLALEEGLDRAQVQQLQVHFGLAWMVGCASFGLVVSANSSECRIARQYLTQAALLLCSLAIFSLSSLRGHNAYLVFVWIYGISYGGYVYSLRMYIFQKVRARNFARAWGFAQFAMGWPNMIGVPATMYLNHALSAPRRGFILSATAVLLSSISLLLVDLHKHRLRQRKKAAAATDSISLTATTMIDPHCPAHPSSSLLPQHPPPSMMQVVSGNGGSSGSGSALVLGASASSAAGFPLGIELPVMPAAAVVAIADDPRSSDSRRSTQSGIRHQSVADDIDIELDLDSGLALGLGLGLGGRQQQQQRLQRLKELTLITEEGLDLLPELEELEEEEEGEDYFDFLENITSCNKVEQCVMLSEFEQNLSKECEEGGGGGGGEEDLNGVVVVECGGSGSGVKGLSKGAKKRGWNFFKSKESKASSSSSSSSKNSNGKGGGSKDGSSSSSSKLLTVIEENSV